VLVFPSACGVTAASTPQKGYALRHIRHAELAVTLTLPFDRRLRQRRKC
jgi:hypothetical protein